MKASALVVILAVAMLLLEARALGLPLLEEEMPGVVDREEMTGVLHQQRQQLGEEAIAVGRVASSMHRPVAHCYHPRKTCLHGYMREMMLHGCGWELKPHTCHIALRDLVRSISRMASIHVI